MKGKMKGKMKAIILHGTGNDWTGNWIPWVKAKLEERGFEVYAPSLPESDFPNAQKWVDFVVKNVPFEIDEETVVVGHSAGAALIPQLLQELPKGTKIKKAILVAGFHTDLGWEKLKEAQNVAVDYEEVSKKAGEFILIYSDNDPYVPMVEVEWLAEKLHGTLKLIKGQGHFNLEASPKYKEFPKVLAVVLRERQIVVHGVYRHYKGGLYLVEGVARHSEDLGDYVVYRPLYGDSEQLWVRPMGMFLEKYDGVHERFEYLEGGVEGFGAEVMENCGSVV
jgi:predicted alpha/beta hydrolase family esterase